MPMLTMLRIGLPVWPFHSPERTRSAKAAIRSSTSWTSATTSTPSTTSEAPFGMRKRDVQHRAVLGHVDLLAGEHAVPVPLEPGLLGQLEQQAEGLVGDPVLRVVEVEPDRLRAQPLAPGRVLGEQLAQVPALDLRMVLGEGRVGRAAPAVVHVALGVSSLERNRSDVQATEAVCALMRSISSFHALDERLGPVALQPGRQRGRVDARGGERASSASASPPSAGIGSPTSPWS